MPPNTRVLTSIYFRRISFSMDSFLTQTPQVGDEEGFLNYEEKVIYDLQKAWYGKKGMEGCAVVSICEQMDSLIYSDALKECNLSQTANVWNKRECIAYYQDKCEQLIRNLEGKDLNWKKLFDESRMNARHVLQTILKSDGDRKSRGSSDAYKAASRALQPKARKSAIGFSIESSGTGRRKSAGSGKGRGQKSGKHAAASTIPNSTSYGTGLGAFVDGEGFDPSGAFSPGPLSPTRTAASASADVGLLDEAGGLDDFGFDFDGEDNKGVDSVNNESSWMDRI